MSRTAVGPFGSYLPVFYHNESFSPDYETEDIELNMTTYQLPPPTLPTRSQYGSDLSQGFTEPNRYDAASHSRRLYESQRSNHDEQSRRTYHEPLPSVSQLLTPGSQSSIPASPFSDQHSPDPSEAGNYAYHGNYENVPIQPQHRDKMDTRGNNYHAISPVIQYQTYSASPTVNGQPYGAYSEPVRQAQHPNQPRQIAPLAPSAQFYSRQPSSYDLSISGLEPNSRDPANVVKPLPRVVGEQIVPGEGPCWVYEDGSTCKKVIDGEAVNAQWGITKAGKPRKRLAIACTTCREKKIKCDPGDPKCVQCEKYGRECRFTTAHRGQQARSESPSYDDQARTPSMNPHIERPIQPSRKAHAEAAKVDKKSTDFRPLPDLKHVQEQPSIGIASSVAPASSRIRPASKRRRQKSPDVTGMKPLYKPSRKENTRKPFFSDLSVMTPWEAISGNMNTHSFDWGNDPYDVDSDITMHYVETYFIHINSATYRIFPRDLFIRWLINEKSKTPDDLMLVYTMLAMGSVFSSRTERKHEGSLFGKIARYAVERNHGNYSLQLIQSRILLAFFHFSMGDAHKAWDYGGMGFRVASGLRFNLEEGVTDIGDDDIMDYGLNKYALEECRRRTFWAAYMMDRFSGFCSGHFCAIHNEDTFVRLPCREEVYNRQEPVNTPYFDNELTDQRLCQAGNPSELGPMAFYAQISSIWGEVLANIYRSPHQSVERYSADHEAFHVTIHQRLHSWKSSLPEYLSYNTFNTTASIDNGYVGTFISLHTIYHSTIMKLNRNIRHANLSPIIIARSTQEAVHHALQLLEMMQVLANAERQKVATSTPTQTHQQQRKIPFSTPFAGYAILTAIDILSAGGSLDQKSFTSTLRLMNGGLCIVEELSQFWASAKAQCKAIWRRVEKLAEEATAPDSAKKKAWITRRPMDKTFDADQDVFYNQSMQEPRGRTRFLENLNVEVSDGEVLVVGGEMRKGGWWE